MTTTQIASMNPIARTASIFNSLPAEIFCHGFSRYDKPGGGTIPIHSEWAAATMPIRRARM